MEKVPKSKVLKVKGKGGEGPKAIVKGLRTKGKGQRKVKVKDII